MIIEGGGLLFIVTAPPPPPPCVVQVSYRSMLDAVVEFISGALALDKPPCPEVIKGILQQLHGEL